MVHSSFLKYPANVIGRWGAIAASVAAILGLIIMLVNQVWPWCVSAGLGDRDEMLRENTKAVKKLTNKVEKLDALLEATIKTAGERVHENDLRAEKLHGSIEALRNEVRLRHGVLDVVRNNSEDTHSSVPKSRRQQVKAVVKKADEELKKAGKTVAPASSFQADIAARLK